MFRELIRELAVISVIAAFAEMFLPNTAGKRPVYFVFGLYFIALLLNPLVEFWTDTDLSAPDFSALAEERTVSVAADAAQEQAYKQTAENIADELERKLKVLFPTDDFYIEIVMTAKGYEYVTVNYGGIIADGSEECKIRELAATDYGIGKDELILNKRGTVK